MKLFLLTVALSILPAHAFGQFQLDIERIAVIANKPEEIQVEKEPQPQHVGWAPIQNIDAWVFNQHGDAATAKRYLENQLKAKLASFSSHFGLDDDQKQKLLLAGRGDMESFFADIEIIRDEFKDEQDQNKINEVYQRIQPLQQKLQRGLFSGDSVLSKVSKRTLDEDQRKQFEESEKRRFVAGYHASIKFTVSELEKSTPFSAAQREEIVALLEASPPPNNLGQYSPYYVLYQLSKNRDKVKEILDPGQMKAMRQALNQGQQMEPFLKQHGFIE